MRWLFLSMTMAVAMTSSWVDEGGKLLNEFRFGIHTGFSLSYERNLNSTKDRNKLSLGFEYSDNLISYSLYLMLHINLKSENRRSHFRFGLGLGRTQKREWAEWAVVLGSLFVGVKSEENAREVEGAKFIFDVGWV